MQAFFRERVAETKALEDRNLREPALIPLETNKYQGYLGGLNNNFIQHDWYAVGVDISYVVGLTTVAPHEKKVDVCINRSSDYLVDSHGHIANNSKHSGYLAAVATMVFDDGAWKVDWLQQATFSCAGLPQ